MPDMLLAAHLRVDPDLMDVPFALAEGENSRSRIAAVSTRARLVGVEPGMDLSQALALCALLVVRRVSLEAVTAAMTALLDVARTTGPRVESNERDRVFLDCAGTRVLSGSEASLANALTARAQRCGLDVWVGIADSKLAAYLAARESGGVGIVPPGRAREFLAPRPLSVLEPDAATASTLASWGIRTIGDLLALPLGTVAHRLGANGSKMVRRARGEDEAPFVAQPIPPAFEEHIEFEHAIDRIEPLVFVLHRLLEYIAARMESGGVGCREIAITVGLENGGQELRKLPVAAPTVDVKTLLVLARTHLESRPPAQSVWSLHVSGVAARIQPTQLDFLEPAGPAPAALAVALARLTALCGADRVGVLRPVDSHRPDCVQVHDFTGRGTRASVGAVVGETEMPRVVRLALRVFRPAVDLDVFEGRKFLEYVRGPGFGGGVVHWAGPWRVRGEWWTDDPFAREYYDVELTDGGIYRMYRNARSGRWLADGVYD